MPLDHPTCLLQYRSCFVTDCLSSLLSLWYLLTNAQLIHQVTTIEEMTMIDSKSPTTTIITASTYLVLAATAARSGLFHPNRISPPASRRNTEKPHPSNLNTKQSLQHALVASFARGVATNYRLPWPIGGPYDHDPRPSLRPSSLSRDQGEGHFMAVWFWWPPLPTWSKVQSLPTADCVDNLSKVAFGITHHRTTPDQCQCQILRFPRDMLE